MRFDVRKDEERMLIKVGDREFVFEDATEQQMEEVAATLKEGIAKESWTMRKQLSILLGRDIDELVDGDGKPWGIRLMRKVYKAIQDYLTEEVGEAGKGSVTQ